MPVIAEAATHGCDLVIFPELALATWARFAECAAARTGPQGPVRRLIADELSALAGLG